MTTRRIFASAVCTALLTTVERVLSQSSTSKRRVAYLSIGSPASSGKLISQFTSGMRALGWNEGGNLNFDIRYAHGDAARWAPLTRELLALQPDVFVAPVDFVAVVAAAATKTVPIVFIIGNDPMARGLIKSLAKPEGNVTGFNTQEQELGPKRLALLKEAIPGLTTVGAFFDSKDAANFFRPVEDAGRRLGIALVPAAIDKPEDIDGAFEKVANAGARGLLDLISAPTGFVQRERIAGLAIKHRMAMMGVAVTADSGVLLAYGYDFAAMFKRAASIVDRILKGSNPADIPVEQVNVYELTVNLRTARVLGIELPPSLMLQVNRVIE